MKVSIQALGSLGDILPQIALAHALQALGHEVTLLAPRDFTGLITAHGVTPAAPAPFSFAAWMEDASDCGTLSGPVSFFRDWNRAIAPLVAGVLDSSRAAAADADMVVSNLICATARAAALEYRRPFVLTALQPVLSPSGQTPCAMIWRRWHGQMLNRLGYASVAAAQGMVALAIRQAAKARGIELPERLTDLGRHLGDPLVRVTSVSPLLMPAAPTDWPPHSYLTAYPKLPASLGADPQSGAGISGRPIYVGLGSMVPRDRDRLLQMLCTALDSVGQKGVFATTLIAESQVQLGDHQVIGPIPHAALFPRCAAIIHHGGAGTLDNALRAARPQIILPQVMDQFWHAHRLAELGVAPRMASRMTAETLGLAIRTAVAAPMQRRAEALAQDASARDGAVEIADLIIAEARRRRLDA